MARVEVPIIVLNSATGLPVPGASVVIKHRATNAGATWWSTETGSVSSTAAIVTDSSGRTNAWVERGAYVLEVSGTGITPYSEPWDAAPAGDATIDSGWVGPELAHIGGLNAPNTVRRKDLRINTEESLSATFFSQMATPDRVDDVYIPDNSILFLSYRALIKESVVGAARVTISIGGTILNGPTFGDNADPGAYTYGRIVEIANGVNAHNGSTTVANLYRRLHTAPPGTSLIERGLTIDTGGTTVDADFGFPGVPNNSGGFVLTPLPIEMYAGGTYDIGVFFRATSGTVTVKKRRLTVWVVGF